MAVLKNKTQGNFVIVSQSITKDKLIDYGYVTREQERGGNGKFGTNVLEVHDEPVRDEDNPCY